MHIVLVSGFMQTPSSWDGVRAECSNITTTAITIPLRTTFATTADALADAVEGGQEPAVWCGYSMGGRLALHFALSHPTLVRHLVLVSTTAGLRTDAERTARRNADAELARAAIADGPRPFLDRWMALPMFAGVAADAPGLNDRYNITSERIAHELSVLGTGAMPNLWDRLPELQMPVTIVTGDADEKFSALGDELAAAIRQSNRVRLDCGHSIPLECPSELAAVLHDVQSAAARNNDDTI